MAQPAEISPTSATTAVEDNWAHAPGFPLRLQRSAKALEEAIAAIDDEEMTHITVAQAPKVDIPSSPVCDISPSTAVESSPAFGKLSPIDSDGHTPVIASGERASATSSPEQPTKRTVRQPIQRKVISSRPDELESEEELDTDMEMDVVIDEKPEDENDGESEDIPNDHASAHQASSESSLRDESPFSDLSPPPPSDEEDNYLASLAESRHIAGRTAKPKPKRQTPPLGEAPVATSVDVPSPESGAAAWQLQPPSPPPKYRPLPMLSAATPTTTQAKRAIKSTPNISVPKAPKPKKTKKAKANAKPAPPNEGPVRLQLCGYPNPHNSSETCGVYTGGEVEQRRHRMKHLYLEWLNMKLGRDVPMVFGGYEATFASCNRCGKLFSRAYAADRHAKERSECPQLSKEELTNPDAILARYRRELEKAEKWAYYIPTPMARPREALVIKSGTWFKLDKIIEVYETFDDRYDMVACKSGTDYEIKFFTKNEPGGFKWYTSMGRQAYHKGDARALRGNGYGKPPAKTRIGSREHSVSGSASKKKTRTTSSPISPRPNRGKARSKLSLPEQPQDDDEEVDMLYAED